MIKIIRPLLASFILLACNNSDNNETPEEETFLCCGDNSFQNVNNLDESNGIISVYEVFSPNGDGINDYFGIENIELYTNNIVSIYDLNDNLVFEVQNCSNTPSTSFFGVNSITNEELPSGSYKYKVIVENEQTYLNQGYLCIVRDFSDAEGFSFSSCPQETPLDPLLL